MAEGRKVEKKSPDDGDSLPRQGGLVWDGRSGPGKKK